MTKSWCASSPQASAITDIGFVDDWSKADGPVVLGHEGAGVVEQIGKSVKGVKCGDPVVLSYQSCGHCRPCRKGHPTDCERFYEANFGFARLDGSNALQRSGVRGTSSVSLPLPPTPWQPSATSSKVPKNLPLGLLSPLGCGMQTGAGTVMNRWRPGRGKHRHFRVGAVGLAAVMAAQIVGASPIIGVDIIPCGSSSPWSWAPLTQSTVAKTT